MMKRFSGLLSLLTIVGLLFAGCQSVEKKRKTLFVIMDGVPADNIERLHPSTVFEIGDQGHYSRGYCGGKVGQYSQTPTISAVGYNNILTGTWVHKHNVHHNENQQPNYNYWSIFRIAKEQKTDVTTAIYSSWTDNRTMLLGEGKPETGNLKIDYVFDGYDLDYQNFPKRNHDLRIYDIDSTVCERAADCIRTNAPDLNWVYLWYTDDAYHWYGDGAFADEYVLKTDALIGKVWDAVKYREEHFDEEWLVIVLSDHGRDELGYDHGGQSDRARTIWMSTNLSEVNDQFAEPYLSHTDVNPTICKFMGFEIPRDLAFEFDGSSFYGPRDIYALESLNYDNSIILRWKIDQGKGMARVFMCNDNKFATGGKDDWKEVAIVPVTDGECKIELDETDHKLYKFAVQTDNTILNLWHCRHADRPVSPIEYR